MRLSLSFFLLHLVFSDLCCAGDLSRPIIGKDVDVDRPPVRKSSSEWTLIHALRSRLLNNNLGTWVVKRSWATDPRPGSDIFEHSKVTFRGPEN